MNVSHFKFLCIGYIMETEPSDITDLYHGIKNNQSALCVVPCWLHFSYLATIIFPFEVSLAKLVCSFHNVEPKPSQWKTISTPFLHNRAATLTFYLNQQTLMPFRVFSLYLPLVRPLKCTNPSSMSLLPLKPPLPAPPLALHH